MTLWTFQHIQNKRSCLNAPTNINFHVHSELRPMASCRPINRRSKGVNSQPRYHRPCNRYSNIICNRSRGGSTENFWYGYIDRSIAVNRLGSAAANHLHILSSSDCLNIQYFIGYSDKPILKHTQRIRFCLIKLVVGWRVIISSSRVHANWRKWANSCILRCVVDQLFTSNISQWLKYLKWVSTWTCAYFDTV